MRARRPIALALLLLAAPACSSTPQAAAAKPSASAPASRAAPPSTRWRLAHHETFNTPFAEPKEWVEDRYGDASPYHVDAYDEDGAFFREKGGPRFTQGLAAFRSFRKSYSHGDAGWLTVELYGRDSDRDGIPETGGHFLSEHGKAKLVSARHYDGAILRSTDALFGNEFLSFTPQGFVTGTTFADKYLPDETYVYAVERSDEAYTLSISGRFVHGGQTTYRATRPFRGPPPTWHYNQTPEEYPPPGHDQRRTIDGKEYSTWPEGSAYHDYFFLGDPHINFYEGTAEYDDLKLYLPDE